MSQQDQTRPGNPVDLPNAGSPEDVATSPGGAGDGSTKSSARKKGLSELSDNATARAALKEAKRIEAEIARLAAQHKAALETKAVELERRTVRQHIIIGAWLRKNMPEKFDEVRRLLVRPQDVQTFEGDPFEMDPELVKARRARLGRNQKIKDGLAKKAAATSKPPESEAAGSIGDVAPDTGKSDTSQAETAGTEN